MHIHKYKTVKKSDIMSYSPPFSFNRLYKIIDVMTPEIYLQEKNIIQENKGQSIRHEKIKIRKCQKCGKLKEVIY